MNNRFANYDKARQKRSTLKALKWHKTWRSYGRQRFTADATAKELHATHDSVRGRRQMQRRWRREANTAATQGVGPCGGRDVGVAEQTRHWVVG